MQCGFEHKINKLSFRLRKEGYKNLGYLTDLLSMFKNSCSYLIFQSLIALVGGDIAQRTFEVRLVLPEFESARSQNKFICRTYPVDKE